MILTRIHILMRSRGQNSLYHTCTRLRGRGRTHTSALIYASYNKIQSRLTSTSIHFLSLSTRDSPQLKTENSIPDIFWRSSKDCMATAIKSSSGRHKMFWRSLKDNLTLEKCINNPNSFHQLVQCLALFAIFAIGFKNNCYHELLM